MPNTDLELARLAARVGRRLLANRHSVATAESCTGGWIAKALTDIAGSSQWFAEGFVTYSNESKVRRLGVSRSVLRRDGAGSEAAPQPGTRNPQPNDLGLIALPDQTLGATTP